VRRMPRAGEKRGKQPVWLSKVMSYTYNQRPSDSVSTNVLASTRFGARYGSATCEWRRREGRAETVASWLVVDHDGRVRSGGGTGKTQGAGEIGRDAAGHREEDQVRIIVGFRKVL
jgi:hypothetical protein